MHPKHPAIEFLATLPQFQLKFGTSDWYLFDMRNGTVVSAVDSDEPKYRDAIELRFPGSEPFVAELGPYLDPQVMEAAVLMNLSEEEREDSQNLANAAWRRAQERDLS
ncbi:MAG: hypothetical protein LBV56_25170 [Delftia acidovorans]|jgi:hypothetical protein|nr:hypothetical protein [Delftia acidovorans]